MVEDQVMEGVEGAMEVVVVVVQGMATRVVDLVAAVMEVTEAMTEVKKIDSRKKKVLDVLCVENMLY